MALHLSACPAESGENDSMTNGRPAVARVEDACKIVVGVDGSAASVEALRQAQIFAMPLGAEGSRSAPRISFRRP